MRIESKIECGSAQFEVVSGDPYHYSRRVEIAHALSPDDAEALAAQLLAVVALHRNMAAAMRLAPDHAAEIVAEVGAYSALPSNATVVGGAA